MREKRNHWADLGRLAALAMTMAAAACAADEMRDEPSSSDAANDAETSLAEVSLAQGAHVGFREFQGQIVISETAAVQQPFPLDALGVSGRTSLEIFQALRPDQEPPAALRLAHDSELRARREVPDADTPVLAQFHPLNDCSAFVFAGFSPYAANSRAACNPGLEVGVLATSSSGQNWTSPGDVARVGFCNNSPGSGVSSWSVQTPTGSNWSLEQPGPREPLGANLKRRYHFPANKEKRRYWGKGTPASASSSVCSYVVASSGSIQPN